MKKGCFLSIRLFSIALVVMAVHPMQIADAKENKPSAKSSEVKAMPKPILFSYRQTGGFAGIDRRYECNLNELPPDERKKLEALLKDTGLLSSQKQDETLTRGACDMFVYHFAATVDGAEHKSTFDDGTLPKTYKPLVEFLRDKTTDARKKPN